MARNETESLRAPAALSRGGALDALRFLAAFFMVLHHYRDEGPVPLSGVRAAFERGYLATDFFLIVSGYVIGRVYGEKIASRGIGSVGFFLRRAGRVVPAHLLIAAAFVLFVLAAGAAGFSPAHPEWFDWRELPGQVALVQAFGPFGGKGWNAPTWTLSALLVCYLVFPVLWRFLRRIQNPWAAMAVGVLTVAAADAATQTLLGYPVFQMPMHYGVIRALPLFLLGAALARCSQLLYLPPRASLAAIVASLALAAGLQAFGRFDFLTIMLLGAAVLASGAVPASKPSKLIETGALVSFSLFLTNELVRLVYFGAADVIGGRFHLGLPVQWAIWFGGLAAAVVFAFVFHRWVDQPVQTRVRAWLTADGGMRGRLSHLLPTPDPDFDPFDAVNRQEPRVREVILHVGPRPGGHYRRDQDRASGPPWS